MASKADAAKCQWISEREAFQAFATHTGKTESAGHIKPLHWYVACRLVLEGGFDPAWITPRPPFKIKQKGKKKERRYRIEHDPNEGQGGEQTILGGLKTKNVDVVVSIPGLGPVLAVSCKGVTKAFRNLTNRMEETIGECTNLHITYPAMVVGYFAILRANRTLEDAATAPELEPADDATAETPESASEPDPDSEADDDQPDALFAPEPSAEAASDSSNKKKGTKNDLAFDAEGYVVEGIVRFHAALSEMTGRRGIRDEISRYEAMTTVMIEPHGDDAGNVFAGFPASSSKLHVSGFFQTLYQRYEERFVIGAPLLSGKTGRYVWDPASPALTSPAVTIDHDVRSAE
jgi:hypothetical protein